jgi:hypothetical protein
MAVIDFVAHGSSGAQAEKAGAEEIPTSGRAGRTGRGQSFS